MPLSPEDIDWYIAAIEKLDPSAAIVSVDRDVELITYKAPIRSDESLSKSFSPEEFVRATALCLLATEKYGYRSTAFYIECYFKHGHPSSMQDEVDLIIEDGDGLPFAMWEFKQPSEYDSKADEYIRYQLFGTAPLVGAPQLLVFATVRPGSSEPALDVMCIERSAFPSYDTWTAEGRVFLTEFPASYAKPEYLPLVRNGDRDLRRDHTTADFRAVATTFHNEFFSEHPDNVLFANLLKCLLAKIFDERNTKSGEAYQFQVYVQEGQEESAAEVFERVAERYREAYTTYIDPGGDPDTINPKEFAPDRLKTVVSILQTMSLTEGAAQHGDVIGAFFEEILRDGFKQDKGMYFTHDNLVQFMLAAVKLGELTELAWTEATHPEDRFPYVIDPACGSGTFLLRAMHVMTAAIRDNLDSLVQTADDRDFATRNVSEERPNAWAETFLYGLDPKFIMAITAKVNMVLHGDGSAHIFKKDGLLPFGEYDDKLLRPVTGPKRTVPSDRYAPEACESFDVVVSNPPFGIRLSTAVKARVDSTFSLKSTSSSEAFFLERWWQLLKPHGRLGVVVPESLLNSADNVDVRLLLYRLFKLRAIVALPRNMFPDTPTLTSLLFAEKKTPAEIEGWDKLWLGALREFSELEEEVRAFLTKARRDGHPPDKIEEHVRKELSEVIAGQERIVKRGYAPHPIGIESSWSTERTVEHYRAMLRLSGYATLVRSAAFKRIVESGDYEYPVYEVDEVGYKLSKRREKSRPNQLAQFVSASGERINNLHLCEEPAELHIDTEAPETVLDFLVRDIQWT